ncbi:uncharacterized protein LOC141651057 [Silene latifolia]|uniref:uncharacterized protein LOC141651057 n=1 Tax=Silene latifolia TaxID=37657 RepID=UPI003D76FC24
MGIGVVCRDERGVALWGWGERRRQEHDGRVAEAEAVIVGLRWALKMKHKTVRVESDCQDVVDALHGRSLGRSDFHSVISDILDLCNNFNYVSWSLISRRYNRAAHNLAHFCTLGSGNFYDGTTMPRHIVEMAKADLNARKKI